MKRTFILIMLCGVMSACSKKQPIVIEIERDGSNITVVARQVETLQGIQQTLSAKVALSVAENDTVKSDQGDEWKTVDAATEDSKRMARSMLEATISALKEKE